MNYEKLQKAIAVFEKHGISQKDIDEAWNKQFWEGFKAAIEMIDNQLVNYESNELATMSCWDLIEKIREDMQENAALYKKDG